MENYVAYHVHTESSLLDSCTNFKLYVRRAKELNQKAICFSEHGNTYNWIEKKMYCESTQYKVVLKNSVKYFDDKKKLDNFLKETTDEYEVIELKPIKFLYGIEVYLTASLEEKVRDNYHTILISKNYAGFQELNLLIDRSTQDDHFYYKPRITFDEFFNISDNIIKISSCLASPLKQYPQAENAQKEIYEKLLQTYDYYEVQPHVNSIEQMEYNKLLAIASKQYNKPLIAGTDTHSIDKYKAECRSILQKAKHITFSNEDEFDLTYKSYDELIEMFRQQGSLSKSEYMEAINNTNVMADSVESFELDTEFKYPKLYDDELEVFKQLINRKYKEKLKNGVIKKIPQ